MVVEIKIDEPVVMVAVLILLLVGTIVLYDVGTKYQKVVNLATTCEAEQKGEEGGGVGISGWNESVFNLENASVWSVREGE